VLTLEKFTELVIGHIGDGTPKGRPIMSKKPRPRSGGEDLLLAGVSDLADAYTRLSATRNPHRRGKDFERLLQRAFQLAHFEVKLNPRIARPRQTDLSARYGVHRYLLEAKWQTAKTDVDVLDSLRSRLDRTSPDVVGVLVSVTGFTTTVLEQVERERQRPILLIDQEDLLSVLRTPDNLSSLLRTKHEELITHSRVHLGSSRPVPETKTELRRALPVRDLQLRDANGESRPYLTVPGGFASVAFATGVTDVDWSFGPGRGVSVDIPVQARTTDDLTRLIHGLDELGLASTRPTWALQQNDTSWFGVGAGELVQALTNAQQRVTGLASPHHSEQLIYTDTALDGLYTLTAVITAAQSLDIDSDESSSSRDASDGAALPLPVRQCQLSFQLPGIPLDTTALKHLHERFGATGNVYFRPLEGSAVSISWVERLPVDPLATIVEHDPITDQDFVIGLVIRDHYSVNGKHAVLTGWPLQLQDSGFLICALADHHLVSEPPESYWLDAVHMNSMADVAVATVRAKW
jgi:hypothetical protein